MPTLTGDPGRTRRVLATVVLAAASCGGDGSDATGERLREREAVPKVALYYQRIDAEDDLSKFGDVDIIVAVRQRDEAAAVEAIHAHGAKAYRYVQSYWFPAGSVYDGLDIADHLDWAFCEQGGEPRLGREQNGLPWYFVDANERAFRDYFAGLLAELRSYGYDGIMLDRGLAALTGDDAQKAGIWHKTSTCTEDPVTEGASLADAYVGLMSQVHEAGLSLFQNYGFSPFRPSHPFRPDPSSPECQAGQFATCPTLDDAFQHVDLFLNEAVAHPRDVDWDLDFTTNKLNEQHPEFGGRVVGLITEGTLGGDVSREAVVFQFARVRLFDIPIAIFTGDDKCGGQEGLCNRHGIFPELTTAELGEPFGAEPEARDCAGGSSANCVWLRQYSAGVSVVNVTDQPRTVEIDLDVDGCRHVKSLFDGAVLADNECVESVAIELPPWSGRPLLLGEAPF